MVYTFYYDLHFFCQTLYNSYFIGDKSFKAYFKDPVKPRGKVELPKTVMSDKNKGGFDSNQNQYSYGQDASASYESIPGGKMPSYKDIRKIVENPQADPKIGRYYENDANENNSAEIADNQRRVRFSEEMPQIYQPENDYYTNDQAPETGVPPTYQDAESYIPPAGKFYMNPKIELDQYERKFNLGKHNITDKFDGKETVKDLFSHPESDGPLDAINYKKMQIPIDYEIKKLIKESLILKMN